MGKSKVRLSKGQISLLFVSCVFLVSLQFMGLSFYKNLQKDKQVNAAKAFGESVATAIHLILNQNIVISSNIKGLYAKYRESFLKDFEIIVPDLIRNNLEIETVYLAPDGIIAASYPPSVGAKGFQVMDFSDISPDVHKALESRRPTISGPHNLLGGGVGFIVRNPIFDDNDEFIGFAIVSLNWDTFVKEILSRIPKEDSGYHFGVWVDGDEFTVTDSYGYIFKNCQGDISRLVSTTINIPNKIWYLAVEPSEGWKDYSNMLQEMIVSSVFVLAILLGIFFRQISNSKKIYIAQHDDLTDLFSRTTFLQKTEALLRNNPDEKIDIVAADIENFKVTNSMYGTEKCDEVLIYLANCFMNISPYKLCTRFGSDHFIFILKSNSTEKDVEYIERVAEKIAKEAPIEHLTVKYGFLGNVKRDDPVNLQCDKALIAAKSILHNYEKTVANYDGPLSTKNEKSQRLESSFLSALKNGDFKVWLQPKFDAVTEELVGAEALVRWIKDDGTVISPAEFIHVFEDDGLIYRLDMYVFEKVCSKIKYWLDKGKNILPISVNISRTSLQHKNVIKEYERILKEFDLPSEYVPLEITESSTAANKRIKELTEDLRTTGFKIHMDDFGTGLSSLESLNLLPFDVIKLDKSLIDFIGTPVGEELLRHMVELIRFMNLKVIAEGVETKEQLDFLRALRCDHIQGYYYAAPMSYDDFIQFLKARTEQ